MFRLGYNTNGLAHHRLLDSLRLLSGLGYEGVAITPDVGQLDPFALRPNETQDVRSWAQDLGLELSIETGARFLLDAERKHFPTLLEESAQDRVRRVDFLRSSVDLAVEVGAGIVSIWAGASPDGSTGDGRGEDLCGNSDDASRHWDHLCEGISSLLEHATPAGIQIAFEPEPGMFIERPCGYGELIKRLGGSGDALGLCLDVGHLLVTRDLPVEKQIEIWAPRLVHVHLDDIADGIHDHRMFGTGELDLKAALSALIEVGYDGMAAVELSRDSHRGAQAAEEAMAHLRAALGTPISK
ncbi:MAG: L-ribulose-5-phosphate 3-epimerase [Planctomycetota bacterium]|jgi:L-ribulose-5-phosphate 3-epimerase